MGTCLGAVWFVENQQVTRLVPFPRPLPVRWLAISCQEDETIAATLVNEVMLIPPIIDEDDQLSSRSLLVPRPIFSLIRNRNVYCYSKYQRLSFFCDTLKSPFGGC
jgi:hypothetical protein